MVPGDASQLRYARTFLLCFLFLWFAGLVFWWNNPATIFRQQRVANLPFGFLHPPGGGIEAQDLAYNLVFFRGIRDHVVSRPYRLADQEVLARRLLPQMTSGLSHGYSPIAFVLALPLLQVSGAEANLLYGLVSLTGTWLLFSFYLLPRCDHPVQLAALGILAISASLMLTVALGQSSLLTVPLLGWLWVTLQGRTARSPLTTDLILGLLFWALCLKPNVGVIALALLLGAFAWRPIVVGFGLLAGTWLIVAPLYGGWWNGFWDYLYLLNHYNNADFTPFMRRDYATGHDAEIRGLFAFDRISTGLLTLALVALRWARRISLAEMFHGLIATFLLFSPYLLPSEDWILCLFVVEGEFFRESSRIAALGKLLLLFGLVDLRAGFILPWEFHFQLKCLFFGWWLVESLQKQWRTKSETSPIDLPPKLS